MFYIIFTLFTITLLHISHLADSVSNREIGIEGEESTDFICNDKPDEIKLQKEDTDLSILQLTNLIHEDEIENEEEKHMLDRDLSDDVYVDGDNADPLKFQREEWPTLKAKILSKKKKGHDHFKTTDTFIEELGLPVEVHSTTTVDGYKLVLFRIPPASNVVKNTPIVVIQHGLFSSSSDLVVGGEGALPFVLYKAGYDVWMPNSRGNVYSSEHKWLDPKRQKHKFWNFSFHEMGIRDLPAYIEYILKLRPEEKQIDYVGHSMGTTMFYVMCSELPEYNEKIRSMISMAPVAFMYHMTSRLLRYLGKMMRPFEVATRYLKINIFKPLVKRLFNSIYTTCQSKAPSVIKKLCSNFLVLLTGFDSTQIKYTNLHVILSISPAKVPIKVMFHYAQLMRKRNGFRQYNYGVKGNFKVYNQEKPPDYDLHKVTAPVALIYSKEDWMTSEKDVLLLKSKLNNVVDTHEIPIHPFSHTDFIWGRNIKTLINKEVLRILKRFNSDRIICPT